MGDVLSLGHLSHTRVKKRARNVNNLGSRPSTTGSVWGRHVRKTLWNVSPSALPPISIL